MKLYLADSELHWKDKIILDSFDFSFLLRAPRVVKIVLFFAADVRNRRKSNHA